MREISDEQLDTWTGGDFTGENRPIARVTIQRLHVNLTKVDPKRLFATSIFGQADRPREMPNVKSVSWERSIGSDVATCTIVFYNTTPLPLGQTPVTSGDLDLRGYYTFNYGVNDWNVERWGQAPNRWQDYLVPDRLIRTYEGYGWDATEPPETDPHLTQTGMWLIDEVDYTSDGMITVSCRDVGRLLLDHICFPPVIPLANYPLSFEALHDVPNKAVPAKLEDAFRPTYQTSSNVPYVGLGGAVHGHYGRHAFDSSGKTYWMSIGNGQPRAGYSYEYVQGNAGGHTVAAVKYRVWGGPYRVYVSIKVGGKWLGRSIVPYDRNNPVSAPNGADIHYVASHTVGHEGTGTFTFKTPYKNVQAVRLCFTDLYNSGIGPFRYRSGVRDVVCYGKYTPGGSHGKHKQGNYGDYSEIVKYLLACGGFYWPNHAGAFFTYTDGSLHNRRPSTNDPYLVKGRIWGDIMMSGTTASLLNQNGLVDVPTFDKKPLMDGIAFVRDILGFNFFIEETGGAVFRLANVYEIGNYVGNSAADAGFKQGFVDPDTGKPNVLTIDEKQTLIGLTAKLSSHNIRESVFIANASGKIGAVASGFNPVTPDPGLRRVGGWTDQGFVTVEECQRMADMIVVRQAFEYRTNQLTIVATPAIQIDDQVRIYERTTGEGSIHYVKSISSTNDLEEGKWTYALSTHWLGEQPYSRWAFDPAKLSKATRTFLDAIHKR